MRFSAAVLLGVFATTSAFTAPQKVGKSSALHSTAVAAKQPTRFDRLKKLYKGPRPQLDPEVPIAFSYDDFEAAVADTTYAFERNTVVTGIVVEHGPTGCIVDIGAKASAFLPTQETSLAEIDTSNLDEVLPLETPTEFQIISEEDENGQLLVSIKRLQFKQAWKNVEELAKADEVVQATVISVNRGGAICSVEGLRAFLPGSHLSGKLPDESLIGETLPLKFLEVSTEKSRLVVSHRKAIVEEQMANLSRGDLVDGVVKALKPYGAFVEVGGMFGLLHISQISHDHIDNLEAILQPGSNIKCMIIDHDKANGRIALATKPLEMEAGDMVKDPEAVYATAEEAAKKYHEKMAQEREAREETARKIVMGLGGDDDDDGDSDPLKEVSDSLDSLL